MWSQIWFLLNCFFVGFFIAYLFIQRAYVQAQHTGSEDSRLRRIAVWRNGIGIAALVFFVLMAASFVINMRVNR